MPYLYTERANANFGIKGLKFESHLRGRTWVGFAKANQAVADQAKSYPQIKEITEEEYEQLKKNAKNRSREFVTSVVDPSKPIHAQSVVAEQQTAEELLMVE